MFHKSKIIAWAAALLLLALPAAAVSTWDIIPGTSNSLQPCSFIRHDICFSDFDADEASPILDTRKCENYTIHFQSDTLADGTFDTTVNIFWNVSGTVDANFSEIVDNKTLTGNPATGLDVLAGFDAPWIYADIANYAALDNARVSVQCWKRRW